MLQRPGSGPIVPRFTSTPVLCAGLHGIISQLTDTARRGRRVHSIPTTLRGGDSSSRSQLKIPRLSQRGGQGHGGPLARLSSIDGYQIDCKYTYLPPGYA